MVRFFTFAGYEYKKMFMRKGMLITIAAAFVVIAFVQMSAMIPGLHIAGGESEWAALTRERDYSRQFSDRAISSELLLEAAAAYSAGDYRPYITFLQRIYLVYGKLNITESEARDFYTLRHRQFTYQLTNLYESGKISANGVAFMTALDERVSTPIIFENTMAFRRFFTFGAVTSLVAALIIAIGVAPIFSVEYSTGVSQHILTSKYGKGKLAAAKIFTAVSFTVLATLLIAAVNFMFNIIMFGRGGFSAPLQLLFLHSPYPITMGQGAIMFVGTTVLRLIFFGSVLLWVSAKFKSSFTVMVVAVIWGLLSTILYTDIPVTFLYNFIRLFVVVIPTSSSVFSINPYEISGFTVLPFVGEIIVGLVLCVIFLPLACSAFKNYQNG